ncbi:hypothetical protein [Haloarcula pellucida]|uniref:Uncharacterized protein n=1 Tax=Haloarcula pellucida TaxID=1427151 RepID=A0A830GSU6_9EURY|nr:hypothetical protein [Halomicroarcula pellucida]MBX0350476.1 hypothetical protein [Halomicroarcula pellucida]GGO03509.1 hypothetical protein GCM10009030_39220 [Halomicroarcula pellucida]
MGIEIDSGTLAVEFEGVGRDMALEAANRAFSASQEELTEGGDKHGYDTYPVVQSGTPPQWDDQLGGAVFDYRHPAAYFFEVGTQTHTVPGDDVLVFEWPDAPPEVREMFDDSFPTVFLPEATVDGIERIDYVKSGMRIAEQWLEGQ